MKKLLLRAIHCNQCDSIFTYEKEDIDTVCGGSTNDFVKYKVSCVICSKMHLVDLFLRIDTTSLEDGEQI